MKNLNYLLLLFVLFIYDIALAQTKSTATNQTTGSNTITTTVPLKISLADDVLLPNTDATPTEKIGIQHDQIVEIDLSTGMVTSGGMKTLPFDVPFFIKLKVDSDVTSIDYRIRGKEESCWFKKKFCKNIRYNVPKPGSCHDKKFERDCDNEKVTKENFSECKDYFLELMKDRTLSDEDRIVGLTQKGSPCELIANLASIKKPKKNSDQPKAIEGKLKSATDKSRNIEKLKELKKKYKKKRKLLKAAKKDSLVKNEAELLAMEEKIRETDEKFLQEYVDLKNSGKTEDEEIKLAKVKLKTNEKNFQAAKEKIEKSKELILAKDVLAESEAEFKKIEQILRSAEEDLITAEWNSKISKAKLKKLEDALKNTKEELKKAKENLKKNRETYQAVKAELQKTEEHRKAETELADSNKKLIELKDKLKKTKELIKITSYLKDNCNLMECNECTEEELNYTVYCNTWTKPVSTKDDTSGLIVYLPANNLEANKRYEMEFVFNYSMSEKIRSQLNSKLISKITSPTKIFDYNYYYDYDSGDFIKENYLFSEDPIFVKSLSKKSNAENKNEDSEGIKLYKKAAIAKIKSLFVTGNKRKHSRNSVLEHIIDSVLFSLTSWHKNYFSLDSLEEEDVKKIDNFYRKRIKEMFNEEAVYENKLNEEIKKTKNPIDNPKEQIEYILRKLRGSDKDDCRISIIPQSDGGDIGPFIDSTRIHRLKDLLSQLSRNEKWSYLDDIFTDERLNSELSEDVSEERKRREKGIINELNLLEWVCMCSTLKDNMTCNNPCTHNKDTWEYLKSIKRVMDIYLLSDIDSIHYYLGYYSEDKNYLKSYFETPSNTIFLGGYNLLDKGILEPPLPEIYGAGLTSKHLTKRIENIESNINFFYVLSKLNSEHRLGFTKKLKEINSELIRNHHLLEKIKLEIEGRQNKASSYVNKLIDAFDINESRAIGAHSVFPFKTRAEFHITADIGLAHYTFYGANNDSQEESINNSVAPYLGVNFNFFAVNRQANYSIFKGRTNWCKAFSFVLAGTINENFDNDRRDHLFANVNLMTGIGMRITDFLRVGGGAKWYRYNVTQLDQKLVASPYISFSLDFDVQERLRGARRLFVRP